MGTHSKIWRSSAKRVSFTCFSNSLEVGQVQGPCPPSSPLLFFISCTQLPGGPPAPALPAAVSLAPYHVHQHLVLTIFTFLFALHLTPQCLGRQKSHKGTEVAGVDFFL